MVVVKQRAGQSLKPARVADLNLAASGQQRGTQFRVSPNMDTNDVMLGEKCVFRQSH